MNDVTPIHRTNRQLKSTTLRRSIVKKPAKAGHTNIPTVGMSNYSTNRSIDALIVRKPRIDLIPPTRLKSASDTSRNDRIVKYSAQKTLDISKYQQNSHLLRRNPVVTTNNTVPQTPDDKHFDSIIESSLRKHEQLTGSAMLTTNKKKSRIKRVFSLSAMLLILVAGISIIGYKNYSNLSVKIANSSAGFTNSNLALPTDLKLISSNSPKQGEINFKLMNSLNNSTIEVSKKTSEWDPKSLEMNYLRSSNLKYSTENNKGVSVYRISDKRVTWVNKGEWFEVSGDNAITTEIISKLINSL